jgi:hypothetical protein
MSTQDRTAWYATPDPNPTPPSPKPRPIHAPGWHPKTRPTATVVWTTNATPSPPDDERPPTRR